ncbi:MAG TPA: glycoside hydrolase family 2 TIM barrel-domain containing protein [Rariglobus sp.]|nr:glycoside hydrolase family 2 TIM barrel-domain containing protein [Rariglobus sp.]
MKRFLAIAFLALAAAYGRDQSFDAGWRFLRADAPGAEAPMFDDSQWRTLDVPHDWSIEDLPPKENSRHVGPFDPDASENKHFTANTVGGIGWYRKHFTLTETGKLAAVRFDGVYMNTEVWINGHRLGEHPHGYTSFEFDLTPHLKPAGQDNVLAVRVRNEGKNSRWYSGSGIYRHVWFTVTDPVHVPTWGVFVITPEVSKYKALVRISTEVLNSGAAETDVLVRTRLRNAGGKLVGTTESTLRLPAGALRTTEQTLDVRAPNLWSLDAPALYSADVEIVVAGKTIDTVSTPFGIRKIEVDAAHGFRLNGEPLKLKGGCIHHDNGPLGAAAIDRAEERKVELLKANGFNALRSSHNPPSPALLAACDRLGMLVIDEAFDQWNKSKERNQQDYHRFFKDWFERDIASMVRRDRNHPSVVMWSVGNEIPEQFNPGDIGTRLRAAVLSHDPTRPVTQAVSTDWGKVIKNWDQLSDPAFAHLDVAGYNYLPDKYESDHARHPERVILTTESYPKDVFEYWELVEKHPYVIGDFVWTAMDYLGESGLAHNLLSNQKDSFFMPWPWFNAWSGDLDMCGEKKPQSFYRDVVWRRSAIEMAVHAPIPSGLTETLSGWAWPNEHQSWTWSGHEGTPLQVSVYSRCDTVRLELNGKVIGENPVSPATKLTVKFDVPYAPGELRASGLINGKIVAWTTLTTAGAPKKLKLTADRTKIRANRNDLSYVTVEVVDARGQRVPDAVISIRFSVSGAGELAGQASAVPNEPASFRTPVRKTFQGRALAILRPLGAPGTITLQAAADGFPAAEITVIVR